MTHPLCVRCFKPTPDGYACPRCGVERASEQLAEIASWTAPARDVAHGQSRRGPAVASSGGGGLPVNLSAQARLDAVQNALTGWARNVAEERGIRVVHPPHGLGPVCWGGCAHHSCATLRAERAWTPPDPLVTAAWFLRRQLEWLRHAAFVGEVLGELADCHSTVSALIDGASPRRYLGPCGEVAQIDISTLGEGPGTSFIDGPTCDGDVYAREGVSMGRCRTCGVGFDVRERRAWLDTEVRESYLRIAHIADALGLKPNTITKWVARGRLVPLLVELPGGFVGPPEVWRDDRDRIRVRHGDVVVLAEQDAERRRLAAQRREQREAQVAASAA